MFHYPTSNLAKMAGFLDPSVLDDMKSTDAQDPFITVQILESDIYDEPPSYSEDDPSKSTGKKPSWTKRLRSSKDKEKTKGVRMRRSELTIYFLKDPKTKEYRKDVIEPPGGRKRWLQERIEEFESGMLDESAYDGNLRKDYIGLRKQSAVGKVGSAVGTGMDFFGQPYTFYAGQGIKRRPKEEKE